MRSIGNNVPSNNISISAEDFKAYRRRIGFENQATAKKFLGAKDIVPAVDLGYIQEVNDRIYEMISRINSAISNEIKIEDLNLFKNEFIDHAFEIIRESNILPVLNNQGRRPEQVYFSWMRGYVISNFFLKALSLIFEINPEEIDLIGDDDLRNIETFKRTPTADLEIPNLSLRIEMQSGFTGTNDIKQHKVLEARRALESDGVHSLAIHFDLYNGQVAFIKLDEIEDCDINWITRPQLEGQKVFTIDQNYFIWRLVDSPPKYRDINFE